MAIDPGHSQEPSKHHGDASAPYVCRQWPAKPMTPWAIDYGKCRHSLDVLAGMHDPRCPADCKHKASRETALAFDRVWSQLGAHEAARQVREGEI